jgi:methyltransferase (TIGR00027 family)
MTATALLSAAARAAHPLVDRPPFIDIDPLAEPLVAAADRTPLDHQLAHADHPVLRGARCEAVCRSRYALDTLRATASAQCVVLGAGLDTTAYRGIPGMTVFEVDRAESLRWKRQLLDRCGGMAPVRYVPADLAADEIGGRLRSAGLRSDRPTFVQCLGVSMYLTLDAYRRLLGQVARLADTVELVCDAILPASRRTAAARAYAAAVGAAAGAAGEPWETTLAPEQLAELAATAGFGAVATADAATALPAALWRRDDALAPLGLSVYLHARTGRRSGRSEPERRGDPVREALLGDAAVDGDSR